MTGHVKKKPKRRYVAQPKSDDEEITEFEDINSRLKLHKGEKVISLWRP